MKSCSRIDGAAWLLVAALAGASGPAGPAGPAGAAGAAEFARDVKPLLETYCWDCHAEGANKGGVAFDAFKSEQAMLEERELWLKALKNLRADLMPPPKKARPNAEEKRQLEQWIKSAVFQADPENPDPGRVTVRRLNRVEYRNTIRDLMGVEFDTEKAFPPDDAGHGFDNMGDVLTLPPILLEKYLAAARTIVTKAVPTVPGVPPERIIAGRQFQFAAAPAVVPPAVEGGLLAAGTNAAAPRAGGITATNPPPVARATNAPGRRGSGRFRNNNPPAATPPTATRPTTNGSALVLSYYEAAAATNIFQAGHPGRYRLLLDFTANERFVDNQFDYNKCRFSFKADGRELHTRDYAREGGTPFHHEFDQDWKPGPHELVVEVQPLTPDQEKVRSLTLRLESVTVVGPMDPGHRVRPRNYARFFPRDVPDDSAGRSRLAREILLAFVQRAYRRPVDERTVDRLVQLAEATSAQPGKTFEEGIAQAMVAVLASPRFLFREEGLEATGTFPLVDEYALASRLSYLFWSSMPDAELFRLADGKKLRADLAGQTRRLLADGKSDALVRNFVGQWLQTRDVESVSIDARQVLSREAPVDADQERRRQRFRELRDKDEATLTPEETKEMEEIRATFFRRFGRTPRAELTGDLRRALRLETEKAFDYILREDRSLLELLDSDYTFLNERLARHYGLTNLNVTGDELVRVKLPADSPRGGVLTHGSVLAVTSNPTRTSPVKRGLFLLENLLGTPPPPPPPDIPPLEDAAKAMKEKTLSLRETLALHREAPLCSSCHNRMDPLGLALENFNAMGMWRDQERGQPIDATGTLWSGESFTDIRELKRILATRHASEFYRAVTEKLLTYALGRGLEYYDVAAVDGIVERLEQANGRPSALLAGLIESAPFQKSRRPAPVAGGDAPGSQNELPKQ